MRSDNPDGSLVQEDDKSEVAGRTYETAQHNDSAPAGYNPGRAALAVAPATAAEAVRLADFLGEGHAGAAGAGVGRPGVFRPTSRGRAGVLPAPVRRVPRRSPRRAAGATARHGTRPGFVHPGYEPHFPEDLWERWLADLRRHKGDDWVRRHWGLLEDQWAYLQTL
jgi:hypothetical protein